MLFNIYIDRVVREVYAGRSSQDDSSGSEIVQVKRKKIMAVGREGVAPPLQVETYGGGEVMEVVSSFKYLGS